MGFLKIFSKGENRPLTRLPSGSFTIDREGNVVASTLPQSFPAAHVAQISLQVRTAFRSAQQAEISISELIIDYAALRLTARELRGGAMIFLTPLIPN